METIQHTRLRSTFFRALFGSASGIVCIAIASANKKSFKEKYFSYPNEFNRMLAYIDEQEAYANVYFCPQLLAESKRNKQNVSIATCAWADLDECPPQKMLVEPSLVVQTSQDRYQAYWMFETPVEPRIAERLSRRIAYTHSEQGCDRSGWDLSQLMRVPLTKNYKYASTSVIAPLITITSAEGFKYRESDFIKYPKVDSSDDEIDKPLPGLDVEDYQPESILEKYKLRLNPNAVDLYSTEPANKHWSQSLWSMMMYCFEAGMTLEEVYVVANTSKCNKFRRDNRPPEFLWRDVQRAERRHKDNAATITRITPSLVDNDELLIDEQELDLVNQNPTWVERYIEWAKEVGDAAPQYHQAGAFVALSSLLSGSIRLPTSYGVIIPNLWFMILADCLTLDTPVLTPTGWVTMKELQVGDSVIGRSGKPTRITHKSEVKYLTAYRVTLRDGATIECSRDHLWTAKIDGYERTVPLHDLLRRFETGKGRNVALPVLSAPAELSGGQLPIDPYLLGIWLGEGCRSDSGYVAFANGEEELVENVRKVLPPGLRLVNYTPESGDWKSWTWHIKPEVRLGPNPVRNYLEETGLLATGSADRFIPEQYKLASVSDRISLLQGILDGEGHCMKSGNIKMDSTSKYLINDTIDLIRSLGGIAQFNGPRTAKSGRPFWTITFTAPTGIQPFRLKRKSDRVRYSSKRYVGIKSIEELHKKEMQCIKVEASDGLYVAKDYTVTHNTTLTRKSTSMDLAMEMITEVDDDVLLATDGSIEGLFQSLSVRPRKPSIFLRDEFSGLIEQMTKRDYMAGMAEMLAKLYDGKHLKKLLRRETIEVRDPILIIYAGGIRTRTQELLNYDHVSSGFLPRFVFVTAKADITRVRPLGPPTENNWGGRAKILDELGEIANHYRNQTNSITVQGKRIQTHRPKMFDAQLTDEAWLRYGKAEAKLNKQGVESTHPDIFTPLYDRLGKSVLKSAVLLAAARKKAPGNLVVDELDVIHALSFGQMWKMYAKSIVAEIGLSNRERLLNKMLVMIRAHQEGVPRSHLMQNFHLSARSATDLIETMVQRNLVVTTDVGRMRVIKATSYLEE